MNQNDNNPLPEVKPKGILFLLDPEYADLIPEQERMIALMVQADQEGTLWVPERSTLH